jgi:hypothetical protein
MRRSFVVMICIVSSVAVLSADPAWSPRLSASAGGVLTAEQGYSPAVGAAYGLELGLATGGVWGAIVQGGAAYQAATAFSAEWYRYRGFLGLSLSGGARRSLGAFDAHLVVGGQLARYLSSYSYFWFPYVEAGASAPPVKLGRFLTVQAGLSIPLQFRADAISASLRAVATLALRPPALQKAEDRR